MDNEKIKVLLVDDDDNLRTIYADVFRREGFDVVEANDGVDGLDKATRENPNVIFTGIIMPRMDGFSLKDALAKNVSTAEIPVLMLSHMGREEDRKKASESGIREFIVQGMISPNQVVEKVRAMFGSGEYHLQFDSLELDAPRLAGDFHFNPKFECPECMNSKLILNLEIIDVEKKHFKARFMCPKCKK
jgi:DNA-binding response OmpR family regulator